jgi:DNA-binding CsgD family transcriptional regulator
MPDESDLIAAIYDASINTAGWGEVVRRLVEATRSIAGGIIIRPPTARFAAVCNADPFYIDAYTRTYHQIDPFKLEARKVAPGEVKAGSYITQSDSFRRSAYYNEYLRPQGWADTIAIGLFRSPAAIGLLCLHRSSDAIWVGPAEWRLLETVAPHLKRAAAVHQLLSGALAAADSLGAAVSAAGFAVFLLMEDCRVVFANAKAEDLVRRGIGFRFEDARLATVIPVVTQRLKALARDAARCGARPRRNKGEAADTLELPRGENCAPLVAHVFPLAANRVASIFDIERPVAAVFVVDPTSDFDAQIRRFGARFGLTAAETRVLVELIRGNGLLAAAASLKISEATGRTHAAHIFEKTGTTRQTELIRRFFETLHPS